MLEAFLRIKPPLILLTKARKEVAQCWCYKYTGIHSREAEKNISMCCFGGLPHDRTLLLIAKYQGNEARLRLACYTECIIFCFTCFRKVSLPGIKDFLSYEHFFKVA